MTTGLDDLQNISGVRKTAVINDELLRLKIDIAALQETRLADSGTRTFQHCCVEGSFKQLNGLKCYM